MRGFDTERKIRLMMKIAPHLFQWERTSGLGARLRYFADKFKRSRSKHDPRSTLPPADEDPIAWYMEIVMASYNWSIAGYRMKRYTGPLALFCSSDLLTDGGSRVAHWQRLYPQLEVHPITGDHLTSITKHASELAEKLRGCFDRAKQR